MRYVEKIEVGYRIRDLTFMPEGRMALLADGESVHFLSRSTMYCVEAPRRRLDVCSINCESVAASSPD